MTEFELYFLQYHDDSFQYQQEAEDMFFEAAKGQVNAISEEEFDRLYEKLAEGTVSSLGDLYGDQDSSKVDVDGFYDEKSRPMWDGDIVRTSGEDYMVQDDVLQQIDILD